MSKLIKSDYLHPPSENIRTGDSEPLEIISLNGKFLFEDSGEEIDASFETTLNKKRQSLRMRTALVRNGNFWQDLIHIGIDLFSLVQKEHSAAGVMVITDDKESAKFSAKYIQKTYGLQVTVLTEDDPSPVKTLEHFKNGHGDVLVAVNMLAEGINVPRFRVGIWLTKKTAKLFLIQTLHRLSRKVEKDQIRPGKWVIPADPRIIKEVKELDGLCLISYDQNNANIRPPSSGGSLPSNNGLFIPISADATNFEGVLGNLTATQEELIRAFDLRREDPTLYANICDVQLAKISARLRPGSHLSNSVNKTKQLQKPVLTYDEERKQLVGVISKLANKLAFMRNQDWSDVHREWLKMGNPRQENASNAQLRAKIAWLKSELSAFDNEKLAESVSDLPA